MRSLAFILIIITLIFSCNNKDITQPHDNDADILDKKDINNEDDILSIDDLLMDSVEISKEWKNLDYDECIIYFTENFYGKSYLVDEKTYKIKNDITVYLKKKIDPKDSKFIIQNIFLNKIEFEILDCVFQPRHAVVFYKNSVPIAQSSICLTCKQYNSIPESGMNYKEFIKILNRYEIPSNGSEMIDFYKKNNITPSPEPF